MMSSVCNPTDTAAYREYDVSLYSWMKLGLVKTYSNDPLQTSAMTYLPANGLADSYEEILCLLGYWRKSLQYDMTIFGTNPKGT
jgi:hypothetical protein